MSKIIRIFNFQSTLFTKIMPFFRLLNLEHTLIYPNFFFEKVLFTTQLSDAEVAEKFLNGIYFLHLKHTFLPINISNLVTF